MVRQERRGILLVLDAGRVQLEEMRSQMGVMVGLSLLAWAQKIELRARVRVMVVVNPWQSIGAFI